MASKTYYYACVSSASSNLARQVEAFHQDGADDHDIITETKSDKDTECSKYNAMKQHMLRSGDTLVVMSLDALGHNKRIIKDELDYYRKNNIRVRVLNIPTSNFQPKDGQEWIVEMMNRLIIEMLTSQLEQERLIKRQHQAEGIAIAKAKGKYKGRLDSWKSHSEESVKIAHELIPDLSEAAEDMIRSHMWPVAGSAPRSNEAMLLCIADKYASMADWKQWLTKHKFASHIKDQLEPGQA